MSLAPFPSKSGVRASYFFISWIRQSNNMLAVDVIGILLYRLVLTM